MGGNEPPRNGRPNRPRPGTVRWRRTSVPGRDTANGPRSKTGRHADHRGVQSPVGRIASRERGGDAVCADGSQRVDLQRDALAAAGVPSEAVYEDRASGKRDGRPGLEACLKALRCGDTLVVWKLDRLGRDLAHLVGVVSGLAERKIGLRVLTGQGAAISTPVRPADVSCSESSRLSRSSSANSFASEHAQVWRRPEPGGERVDASSP